MPCGGGHTACLDCFEKAYKGRLAEADSGKKINRECWECRFDLEDRAFKDYRNKDLEAALKTIFPGYTDHLDGHGPKMSASYVAPPKSQKRRKSKTTEEVAKPGPSKRKQRNSERPNYSDEPEEEIIEDLNAEDEAPKVEKPGPKSSKKPGPKSKAGPKSSKRKQKIESEEENEFEEEVKHEDLNADVEAPKVENPGPKSSKKPGPKSKAEPKSSKPKQKNESEEENVGEIEFGEPVPSTSGYKPGPKISKKEKPGPKSKKRKRENSEDEEEELDANLEKVKAKRPKRHFLGEIDYNIDSN